MRRSLWWVWPPAVAALSLVSGLLADLGGDVFLIAMLVLAPLFAFLSALIATRVPGNPIAWLLLITGLSVPVGGMLSLGIPATAPAAATFWLAVAVFVTDAGWIFFIFPILLVLFLFPTGTFLTPRWRWGGWLAATMVAVLGFAGVFAENLESVRFGWSVPNPIGFLPADVWAESGWFFPLWGAGLAVLAVGGLLSMVVRYRRSTLVARTQIKWFVVPAAAFALFYALSAAIPGDNFISTTFFSVGFAVTFCSLPIAITIAITRYRLYEIDRIVSRTILYVVVLGLMVGVYALALLVLSLIVPADGDLQVAVATLAAVGVTVPVGRRIRRWVDRRFFRSRYDAARVVSAFAAELGATLNLAEVEARAEAVVDEVFAPTGVDIWLADQGA